MLNFPNSPSDGDISSQDNGVSYQWEDAKTRWNALPSTDASLVAGTVVQTQNVQDGLLNQGTGTIPFDNTVPQITEGNQFMSIDFTPKFANSLLRIDVVLNSSADVANSRICVALFQDAIADALAAVSDYDGNVNGVLRCSSFTHHMAAGTTDPRVFKVRAGSSITATTLFNASPAAQRFGGVMASSITVTEIQPNAVTIPAPTDPVISTGMIAPFSAAAGLPWLFCNGAAVDRATYANLFNVIGVTYGDGDGSTTFNLPDYRGEFLRGQDAGAGVDPDAGSRTDRGDGVTGDNVGTKQAEEFLSHMHDVDMTLLGRGSGGGNVYQPGAGTIEPTTFTGGNETRPVNTAVRWYIYSGLNAASIPAQLGPYTAYARIQADGTVSKDNGFFTATDGGTGVIDVLFNNPQPDDEFSISGIVNSSSAGRNAQVTGVSNLGFQMLIKNADGNATSGSVFVICIRSDQPFI